MSVFSDMVLDMEDEAGLTDIPVNMSEDEDETLALRRQRYILAKEVRALEAQLRAQAGDGYVLVERELAERIAWSLRHGAFMIDADVDALEAALGGAS